MLKLRRSTVVMAVCGLLCVAFDVTATAQRLVAMTVRQREAVRAAAAAYAGVPVQVVVRRASPAERLFARTFATALKSAGLVVSLVSDDEPGSSECQASAGLNVVYGSVRSGAVNAIAEALIKSGVTSGSVRGCRVGDEDALKFVVVGTVPASQPR